MERDRTHYLELIAKDLEVVPICALLGPRQSGKTTLAKHFARITTGPVHYFDLEKYSDLAMLENPQLLFESLEGLIIIDEIQRRPDLFPYLRVVADTRPLKFLILGSASRDLIQQSSESLAGRIAYINVTPFQLVEVLDQTTLWTRGGFPRSFLATSEENSVRWRENYLQTYLERDLAQMGWVLPPQRVLSLWAMLAQYHGNVMNYANMAQFLEVSVPTLKNYLALLEGTFMIRTLPPWFENMGKRLVKTPKIYIRDSGILHQLLGIKNYQELILDKHKGASWEGFALEQVTTALGKRPEECYFWSTHQGEELDLLLKVNGKRLGFEFKCTDQPKITKSMKRSQDFLTLDHLYVVTPLDATFPLDNQTTVLSLKDIPMLMHQS